MNRRKKVPASIDVLPTIWFRNRWSWRPGVTRPAASRGNEAPGIRTVVLDEEKYGRRYLYCDAAPELLFTNNETNSERAFHTANATRYVKDAFHDYVIHGKTDARQNTRARE